MKRRIWALLLAAVMLCSLVPITGLAADPAEETKQAEIFSEFGAYAYIFGLNGGYFDAETPVDDNVAYFYSMFQPVMDQYGEYLVDEYKWVMPYSVYMGMLDQVFVHHSDMKAYLIETERYNEATDEVTVVSYGGAGGPWAWEPLSAYQEGNTYYVQGLFLDGDEFTGDVTPDMRENYDWYRYHGSYEDENGELVEYENKMYISEAVELTLVDTGAGYQIAAYTPMTYYIIDGVLYTVDEACYYPVSVAYLEFDPESGQNTPAAENGVTLWSGELAFADTLTAFAHNAGLWREAGAAVSFTAETADGYELMELGYQDANGGGSFPQLSDGTYTMVPAGALEISVFSAKTAVPPVEEPEYTIWEGADAAFTVDGDVMAYENEELLGTYYRLTFDLAEDVTFAGRVYGDMAHMMTTVLKDREGNLSYWVRDHKCEFGCASRFLFDLEEGAALKYELVPASAGEVVCVPESNILMVNLHAPAVLKVTAEEQTVHTHAFGAWEDAKDGANHQRSCECGEIEKQAHAWDAGRVTQEATTEKKGEKTYTCTACGAVKTEEIPVRPVEPDQPVDPDQPATGDAGFFFWAAMLAVSGAGTGAAMCLRRRAKNR